eukprot:1184160-Prorocentrum_minimum.AAC.3
MESLIKNGIEPQNTRPQRWLRALGKGSARDLAHGLRHVDALGNAHTRHATVPLFSRATVS